MSAIHRSRISNTEWGMVIGALLLVDIVQALLNFIAIGLILNRGITFIVGMSWTSYLHIRGEKMNDPKRLGGVLGAFGIEMIPGVDLLPAWTISGIYNLVLAKKRDKVAAKQETEQVKIHKQKKMNTQNERSTRIQQIRQQQEERREEQRLAQQRQTEEDTTQQDDEDLYDRAA